MEKEQALIDLLEAILNLIKVDEIESVEENCGSIWIEKTDGKTLCLSLIECEE